MKWSKYAEPRSEQSIRRKYLTLRVWRCDREERQWVESFVLQPIRRMQRISWFCHNDSKNMTYAFWSKRWSLDTVLAFAKATVNITNQHWLSYRQARVSGLCRNKRWIQRGWDFSLCLREFKRCCDLVWKEVKAESYGTCFQYMSLGLSCQSWWIAVQ